MRRPPMVIVRTMSFRRADGPLSVHVPSGREDRPSWFGVGAIALVGFAIGVAWPRLAGVRLGPAVPESSVASAAAPEASGAPAPASSTASVPAALPVPAALSAGAHAGPATGTSTASSAAASGAPAGSGEGPAQVSVARGTVFACKTASGESLKGSQCGSIPGLDGVVQPRLRKLADCPQAAGTSGKLHLVVHPDFGRAAVTVELGRDRSITGAEALLACAKTALTSASLTGIEHDNPRYSVAYSVAFGSAPSSQATAGAAPAAGANPPPAAADGTAQVEWEVAIVRDAPKTTGKVLSRLPRGTSLRIGAAKDGWYPVKYGDGFGSDGWVYRGAIGK
jgi:hypothetical protein